MRSRGVAACLFGLVLAGCGGPAIFVPASGTLTGHVTLRACGGANREYQTGCPVQPLSGVKLSFQARSGSTAATATTDSTGGYRVRLAPGTYAVTLETAAKYSTLSGPHQVSVVAGQPQTADFTYTIQLM
jgi:Carboxypeptidase regulatory-like domain